MLAPMLRDKNPLFRFVLQLVLERADSFVEVTVLCG